MEECVVVEGALALAVAVEFDAKRSIAVLRQCLRDSDDMRLLHMPGETRNDQDQRYFAGMQVPAEAQISAGARRHRPVQLAVQPDPVAAYIEFFLPYQHISFHPSLCKNPVY